MALVSIPAYLAGSALVIAAFWSLASKLIDLETSHGRHAAPRTFQVSADYDRQTIEIFRTANQPPAKFFSDEPDPDWADDLATWTFDASSIAALHALLDLDQQVKDFRAELGLPEAA